MFNLSLVLMYMSTAFLVILGVYVVLIKEKEQIHKAFLSLIICMLFFNIGHIGDKFFQIIYSYNGMMFVYLIYIGSSFLAISFLYTGLIFAYNKIKLSDYWGWIIIPVLANVALWTNQNHHLFYSKFYSLESSQNLFGIYGVVYSIYSYFCIIIGVFYLVKFSIKKSKLLSRQAFLIIIGALVPLFSSILHTVYVSYQIKLISYDNTFMDFAYSTYSTPVAFSFAIACFWIAIIKYKFLRITPVAFERIFDRLSEAMVTMKYEDGIYKIVNFNLPFKKVFNSILKFDIGDDFLKIIKDNNKILGLDYNRFLDLIKKSKYREEPLKIDELHLYNKELGIYKWFYVEISCIDPKRDVGTIILLKDITQQRENQARMIEKEKILSIGEMAGGFSHSMKSKISAIHSYARFFDMSMPEYKLLIDKIDNLEEKGEQEKNYKMIMDRVKALTLVCEEVNEMIAAINDQMSEFNKDSDIFSSSSFTVEEFINRIKFFGKYNIEEEGLEFILEKEEEILDNFKIRGVLSAFTQAIMNLLVNSLYEYKENNIKEKIILKIKRSNKKNYLNFIVIDYGTGLPEELKNDKILFKKMYTTKGKNGTGIGLWSTRSVIVGKFNGHITLCDTDRGTKFKISIPYINEQEEL